MLVVNRDRWVLGELKKGLPEEVTLELKEGKEQVPEAGACLHAAGTARPAGPGQSQPGK